MSVKSRLGQDVGKRCSMQRELQVKRFKTEGRESRPVWSELREWGFEI